MQNELKTIGRLLLHRVEESAKDKAIGWIEVQEVKSLSFLSYKESIERLCLALIKEKVTIGSKVAILAQTSKEWHLLDLAIQCARGVVVPIYHSYKGNEILHILHHSEASTLIVEDDSQLEKIHKTSKSCPLKYFNIYSISTAAVLARGNTKNLF